LIDDESVTDETFSSVSECPQSKRPDFSGLNPSIGKDYSRELLLFIGQTG
jgi:hypothetical protein